MGDTSNFENKYEEGMGLESLEQIAEEIAHENAAPEVNAADILGVSAANSGESEIEPQPVVEEQLEPQELPEESVAQPEAKLEEEPVANSEPVEQHQAAPEVSEEPAYEPNFQYKFQDEFHEFDDRVKAAIKTKEDEDYYRDLITRARGMEIQKTKVSEYETKVTEWEGKYNDLNSRSESNDQTIQYISNLMEGISRGDSQSFDNLLGLCNVNNDTLLRLGETLAKHIENPQAFVQQQQQRQQQMAQVQQQQQTQSVDAQAQELAQQRTEFYLDRALSDNNVADIVSYVDSVAGEGSFKEEVKAIGAQMVAENPRLTFDDLPLIVDKVAQKYAKFVPASQPAAQPQAQPAPVQPEPVIKQQIVKNNTTTTLPNVSSSGGQVKSNVYKPGSGLDGLSDRYKQVTGDEL